MSESRESLRAARRIVVVMPNWLGDAVMATPFLRALRRLYPQASIAAVSRPLVMPVLACDPREGTPGPAGGLDEIHECSKGRERATSRWMRSNHFDLGILLANSFRSAWMLWRGGVARRLGYGRGRRSWLLTDALMPLPRSAAGVAEDRQREKFIRDQGGGRTRVGNGYEPVATIDYYLELARYLGGADGPPEEVRRLHLAVTQAQRQDGKAALSSMGIEPQTPYVVLAPGAHFGASKCWLADRFAEVVDQLLSGAADPGLHVILVGSRAELPLHHAIMELAKADGGRVHSTASLGDGKGSSVGALLEIIRRARLMICNDTGPRHVAAAFDIPLVTLFGPTDPVWAETFAPRERIVRAAPFPPCGPCQLKQCPIDHRCMRGITVDMVMSAVRDLWPEGSQ